MMTPEPDSSCGRVLPAAGGFTASIETTAGETRVAIDSKRSDNRVSTSLEAGGGDWAITVGVDRGPRKTAARPPVKAQPPSTANIPIRFSMAELSRQVGRTRTRSTLSQRRGSNLTQLDESRRKFRRGAATKGTKLALFANANSCAVECVGRVESSRPAIRPSVGPRNLGPSFGSEESRGLWPRLFGVSECGTLQNRTAGLHKQSCVFIW